MRYALKLRQFPTHPAYPYVFSQDTLSLFLSRPRKNIPFCLRMQDLFARSRLSLRDLMCVDTNSSLPWQYFSSQINLSSDVKKSETLPCEAQGRAKERMLSCDGHVMTFTDGSKTKEGVGCGFVSGRDTRSFSLPANSSVFTFELIAISKALSFIEVGDKSSTPHFNGLLKQPFGVKEFLSESSPGTGYYSPSCVPEPGWEVYPVLLDFQPCWHRRK